MGADPDTVDLEIQRPLPGIDTSDYQISRQFTYFARKVSSVRKMHDIKGSVKPGQQKDWVADPRFASLNSILDQWLEDLPRDLQVKFPDDDTPPWLPSHFVGNMHSYYNLTVIMLHRPQLMHASAYADGSWKGHFEICYRASKEMCRLQEGVLQTFGLSGLLCMQRGINFVIYAVLTCTMIHLVGRNESIRFLESVNIYPGRYHIPRSCFQFGRQRLFYSPYADTRKLYIYLAYAGHADSDRCSPRSVFRRHNQAI